jgi:hypothetical protein
MLQTYKLVVTNELQLEKSVAHIYEKRVYSPVIKEVGAIGKNRNDFF